MAFVAGTKANKGGSCYTREEAKEHFRRAAAVAKKPFIYLSAGVSNDVFNEWLELGAES
jgi:tagatose 1,6-diphosphate aldolase